MRTLVIFDRRADTEKLKEMIIAARPSRILLFPLTSEWRFINELKKFCNAQPGVKVRLIESARHIDGEVDLLRQRVSRWSAALGNRKIETKSLKDWFILSEGETSTWWFSLLSEKNPLKTDIFFNVAQLNAIDKVISSEKPDGCTFLISNNNLSRAIEALCRRQSVKLSPAHRVKNENIFLDSFFKALRCLCVSVARAVAAKIVMGSVDGRLQKVDNSILFASYFPLVDKEAAEKGILKNKYAGTLQEKLSQMEKNIIWLWMFIFIDGRGFKDALKLAATFAKNGEANFFLYEFMTPGLLFRVLFLWLRQIRIFTAINRKIEDRALSEGLTVDQGAPLIRNLMIDSFTGWIGLEGIMFYELYKNLFSRLKGVSQCIYCSEMHAWEKGLNAAKQLKAPEIRTIAFLHASVSRNYFHFFHSPEEIAPEKKPAFLPLPDIFACNGDVALNLMAGCGYPGMTKVEAIRYLYLKPYLDNPQFPAKENIVLISGAINRDETRTMISLFHEAFPRRDNFEVWIKSHPSLRCEEVLAELNISPEEAGYRIKDEPIKDLLKSARVAIVCGSTVALEAAALGCTVIVPVFADYMFLSPLGGFDKFYSKIYTPGELKELIYAVMKEKPQKDAREILDFISDYWCLDASLQGWERVLR